MQSNDANLQTFVIRRTHTAVCRQRHFTFTIKADGLADAKLKVQENQDLCNRLFDSVECDAIAMRIDGNIVHEYTSPPVIVASR